MHSNLIKTTYGKLHTYDVYILIIIMITPISKLSDQEKKKLQLDNRPGETLA